MPGPALKQVFVLVLGRFSNRQCGSRWIARDSEKTIRAIDQISSLA
jgi:hypothetical protein